MILGPCILGKSKQCPIPLCLRKNSLCCMRRCDVQGRVRTIQGKKGIFVGKGTVDIIMTLTVTTQLACFGLVFIANHFQITNE